MLAALGKGQEDRINIVEMFYLAPFAFTPDNRDRLLESITVPVLLRTNAMVVPNMKGSNSKQ
jgi:hypothetical protein